MPATTAAFTVQTVAFGQRRGLLYGEVSSPAQFVRDRADDGASLERRPIHRRDDLQQRDGGGLLDCELEAELHRLVPRSTC